MMRIRWTVGALALLIALGTTGCGVTLTAGPPTVYGYAVAEPAVVPVGIEAYPRAYWEGGYAYLVDGRWYYPTSSGWVVLIEEPRALARYRGRIEAAPRRVERAPSVYSYPRSYPPPPPPRRPLPPRELHREYRPR